LHNSSRVVARKQSQSIRPNNLEVMMDDAELDVLNEFLRGDAEEEYEEEDYSVRPVEIGDGPPSERIRERRQTSSQSKYAHLQVNNYISRKIYMFNFHN
jgi:hypothetical protein